MKLVHYKEDILKEKSIKCKLKTQAGEDQMIVGRIYLPEESPSSTGQDGR
jgi:hypothetical protein